TPADLAAAHCPRAAVGSGSRWHRGRSVRKPSPSEGSFPLQGGAGRRRFAASDLLRTAIAIAQSHGDNPCLCLPPRKLEPQINPDEHGCSPICVYLCSSVVPILWSGRSYEEEWSTGGIFRLAGGHG